MTTFTWCKRGISDKFTKVINYRGNWRDSSYLNKTYDFIKHFSSVVIAAKNDDYICFQLNASLHII